jgi:transcriptional regulator with XRE-family HTH domain
MPSDQPTRAPGFDNLNRHLAELRRKRGLTQRALAMQCGVSQSAIARLEAGEHEPSLALVARLVQVLETSWQYLMTGSDRPGRGIQDLAVELRALGIVDLLVEGARSPGAFRRKEEVIALALSGDAPEPRIVEAMPAVLAWNRWCPLLLRAHAAHHDRRGLHRIGWLASIVLSLEQLGRFPGGCLSPRALERVVLTAQRPAEQDTLGRSPEGIKLPPVSLRWNIGYPATLETFRARAAHLFAIKQGAASSRGERRKRRR